jgi:hypothetical protein
MVNEGGFEMVLGPGVINQDPLGFLILMTLSLAKGSVINY